MVHWLGLHASTAGGTASIPGWGTKIPHAARCGKKKKLSCLSSGPQPLHPSTKKNNNKSLFLIINLLILIKISRRGCTFQTSLPRTHTKRYISHHDSVHLHTGVSRNNMWNVLCSFLFYFISQNYSCHPLNCSHDTIVSWDLQFEEQRIRLRAAMESESETEMGSNSGTLYPKSPVILNK